MVRAFLKRPVSNTLTVAGKPQHHQLHRLNIHEYQGSELMSKYVVNVPKGVAVSFAEKIKNAIQEIFPKENELIVKSQISVSGGGLGTLKKLAQTRKRRLRQSYRTVGGTTASRKAQRYKPPQLLVVERPVEKEDVREKKREISW